MLCLSWSRTLAVACAAVTLIVGAVPAHAQWTAINLHPAGADRSRAVAGSGAQQVGFAWYAERPHAGLWSGTAGSWVDLHPAGAFESTLWGSNGSQQEGWTRFGDLTSSSIHASLWSGTAASRSICTLRGLPIPVSTECPACNKSATRGSCPVSSTTPASGAAPRRRGSICTLQARLSPLRSGFPAPSRSAPRKSPADFTPALGTTLPLRGSI